MALGGVVITTTLSDHDGVLVERTQVFRDERIVLTYFHVSRWGWGRRFFDEARALEEAEFLRSDATRSRLEIHRPRRSTLIRVFAFIMAWTIALVLPFLILPMAIITYFIFRQLRNELADHRAEVARADYARAMSDFVKEVGA